MNSHSVEAIHELSPMQQAMLFHSLMAPGSGVYILQTSLRLTGRLDFAAFEQAWRFLVARHPILRTAFFWENLETPRQVILREAGLALERASWRGLGAAEQGERLASWLEADRRRGFDLAEAPLLRLALIELEEDVHQLVWTQHHLVSDGWSQGLVLRELLGSYAAFTAGRTPELPAARGFHHYLSWLQRQDLTAAEAFWRRTLAGFTTPTFLTVRDGRVEEPDGSDARRRDVAVPAAVGDALRDVARQRRLTVNTLVQGAWALLLAQESGRDDVVFGATVAGRPADLPGVEAIVGPFLNTLPVRVEVAPERRLQGWLAVLQEQQVAARRHEHAPLVEVQRWSDLAPGVALFDHILVFENLALPEELARPLPGLEIVEEAASSLTSYPLNIVVLPGRELRLTLRWDGARYGAPEAVRLLERLARVLIAFAADGDPRLDEVPLLLPTEQHQLVHEWSGLRASFPPEETLHDLFAARARVAPEAPALTWDSAALTYGELHRRSNQLAQWLLRQGVGPESRVGLCLERSPEMLVGILGVLKAGGAYVPLDPAAPPERLAYMVADSGARLVVATEGTTAVLPATVEPILLDVRSEELQALPAEDLPSAADATNLAYVIYTSGSTGQPKGALVTHGNVLRLFAATLAWFSFGEQDVWTLFHSYAFDFSVWEIWGALLFGGRLVIVPREVSRAPGLFLDLLVRERVTVLNQTPSAFAQLAQVDAERGGVATDLRWVIFGGEALDPASLAPWFARHGDTRPVLVNMYGITETTVHVTFRPLAAADARGERRSGLGVPIPDLSLTLLGPGLRPVPIGVPGELVVGGAGLARGYLDRPALTAERFVPDPFGEPGARLYRSGDLGRWLPQGEVEYLGRIDHQVKIRGFRIELGEIEATLTALPGVREAVVMARADGFDRSGSTSDKRLVAYVVGDVAPGALREILRARLPEYMVPAAFVPLAALPLTPNGKVDRKALPAPESLGVAADWVAPSTPVEELVAGIWADVLGVDRVGAGDDFFALGGHSLLATRVVSRLREAFDVDLPLRDLFEAPRLADLAARIEAARRMGTTQTVRPVPPLVPAGRDEPLPLSFAQQRLWFIDQLEPGNLIYNIPVVLLVDGPLDGDILARCLGEIVRRHEALRTVFAVRDGVPVQVIVPAEPFHLPVVDLTDWPEQALARAAEEAGRPFDLGVSRQGPLLRGVLLRLADDAHIVALTLHHIASDGWSMGVLVREIGALYAAFSQGRSSPLPELSVQYTDFAAWQRSWLQGDVLEEEVAYWRRQLADLPAVLDLPTDRPRPAAQSFRGATLPIHLPARLTRQLEALGRSAGATLFMGLLAGFQALLARISGQPDFAVGTPVAGRNRVEIEGLIGFFVNTLALRGDLTSAATFGELLGQVRETALAAYLHQDVPFERLVQELAPERSLGHASLVQAMLTLQNAPVGELALPDLRLTPLPIDKSRTEVDLDLTWSEGAAGLSGSLVYAADLFDRSTMERLTRQLVRLLAAAMEEPERAWSELPLLALEERHQVLVEWSGGPPSRSPLVPELFTAQAERAPEAIAVSSGSASQTYRELAQRAGALARHLGHWGVGPETVVAIFVDRSLDLPASLLGVLAAGGSYVPLDPALPRERLAFLLEDSGAAVVLTQEHLEERLPATGARVLRLGAVEPETFSLPPMVQPIDPDQAAYAIYTSGSTGLPKGAVVTHGALASFAVSFVERLGLTAEDRVLQFAALGFDVVVEEIFPTLLAGGRVVLRDPQELATPYGLARAIAEEGVTSVELPTAFWHDWVFELERSGEQPPACLRRVLTGTERILPERLDAWRRFGVPLVHVFGLTEVTVTSLLHVVPPGNGARAVAPPPVGRPFGGTRAWLLDEALREVPVGVPGELYLGGPGVARGYLRRPDLAAERFVPDPFSGVPGARMYRTGDRLRWRADGTLDFLGRLDRQVKLRGFRIELGEVEAALSALSGVSQAIAAVRDERLIAYLVGDAAPDAELRRLLGERLPESMVPAAFVRLAALPLTPNGKVDRKALPAPERPDAGERGRAARTPVEQVLAGIWAEVLGLEWVGADGHFFDLGGHSLLATQVLSRLRTTFGIELPLRDLFEAPVLAGLAVRVEGALRARRFGTAAPIPPLVPVPRQGPLPLSFAQQRLWFIDQLEPGSPLYNMPVALGIEGPLDARVLALCLEEIARRHESLRTVLVAQDGAPVQVIHAAAPFVLPVVDLSGLPESRREPQALALAGEEAARPFDLARGALLRGLLLRRAQGSHAVALTMHHIASDGWSMDILVREITTLYAAFAAGRPSPLPELPLQYADFAVWQRSWLQGAVLEEQIGYWTRHLAGAPQILDLPTDRPRPPVPTFRGAMRRFALPAAPSRALPGLCRREGVTPFMALLAVWGVLLGRHAGQDDLLVGSPVAGRDRRETEDLIGFFVNTLVFRLELEASLTFRDFLRRVRENALDAFAHQDVPFERLVEALVHERNLAVPPLVQVLFVQQNTPAAELRLPGLTLADLEVESGTVRFDLVLNLSETPDGLAAMLEHSSDLFDPATAERLLTRYAALLEGAVADPGRALGELPLLPPAERQQVVVEWNDTARSFRTGVTLHELVAEQAARTPELVAASFEGEKLTYRELEERAGALAGRLIRLGVEPEDRVGVRMERSLDLIVALLATLKAGAAYVPLDPAWPAERLRQVTASAGARVVLPLASTLPALTPGPSPASGRGENSLAYVLFTSGSTGVPKGVMIPHAGIVNRLLWMQEAYGLTPADRVLQKTPFTFDVSVWEFFWPLLVGARLVLARPEGHKDPAYLVDLIAREEITTLHFVPSMLQAFLEAPSLEALTSIRRVLASGEALPPELVRRFYARLPHATLHNLYGPTEASVDVSFWPCVPEPPHSVVPIGRPISNLRLHVMNRDLRPAPIGVAGELLLGGVGLARGYLGRPELTAAAFVPDPAGEEPGTRLYRTGDLARFLPDGQVEYLGRIDFQVKIRGFRIELGEIETVLAEHPAVRECVVGVYDAAGDRRLVAWVVPAAGSTVEPAGLAAHLRERLPDYMVPAAFVLLEAFPLTSSGKVDRKALLAPEQPRSAADWQAPRTPVEEVLAGIWAELLGLERVGATDRFFDLGGHSLLATQVLSRLRRAFGVELPLRDLFEAPALADLAARVEAALRADQALRAPGLAPVPRQGPMPLSFAQQRLWFIDQLEPGSPLYNLPIALRVAGPLDAGVLERSLQEIVRRHEALRTVFAVRDGVPVQVIQPAAPFALPRVDLTGLSASSREELALRLAGEEANRPFDLGVSRRGPLLRGLLLRLADDDHAALLTMHHIASDGWSMGILVREVAALYTGSPLPELPVQYADFAAWQRSWLHGEILEEEVGYWRRQLAGLPPLLELPTDRPRPAVQSFRGALRPVRLPAGLCGPLEALARREGATLFMALLAGFQALLARHSGQVDLAVGSPVAGRNRVEIEGLIGFFVNTLVLRGDLTSAPSFRELLGRVRETALAAYLHQDVPFEKLIEELAPERSLAQTPLFQVVLALQNAPVESVEISDLRLTPLSESGTTAKFDLILSLEDEAGRGGGLAGTVEYAIDLFDATTVDRLIHQYETLLAAALAAPELPVAELPVLDEAARHQVLVEWNDVRVERDETTLIHQLFEAWAERTPDAVAAVCGGEVLTYGELEDRANRLARHLTRLGVGPGALVGIHLRRGLRMIPAVLAVLKAGAAYVPLEVGHPPARLRWIIETLEIDCLLTESAQREHLPEVGHVICLDQADLGGPAERIRPIAPTPDALAYVIFTSGSTGTPKGVMIRHRPVVNLLRWAYGTFAFSPADRVLFVTALSFDLSVFDVFGLLGAGGSIRIATEDEIRDPERLLRALAEEAITFWDSAPAALEQTVPFLATLDSERLPALRLVFLSGDWIPVSLPDRVRGRFPGARVISLGGATEATVWSNVFPIGEVDPAWTSIPYGRPIENARYYVLDGELSPCPVGVPGDLFIGGDCLTDGYAREPELTAQKLIPDPFAPRFGTTRGARLYRTGDRARYRPDGNLEFLGRRDHQVKIRGFRIELGEIEAALEALPGVREAVVVVKGHQRLVAYVAGEGKGPELREQLRERLPEHMVPATFVPLAALPLTANGKVDRKALPEPEQPTGATESYRAPRTPAEEVLAAIWAELLGLDRVGADGHFFDLGGHSILAAQVLSRLRGVFGVEMPLRDLFEAPVLSDLAVRVEAARFREDRGSCAATPIPPLVPVPREGPLPLSFAQQRLWLIDQLEPGSALYNIPVALRASGPLDASVLALCLGETVRRHEALRTVFAARDGAPVQVLRPAAPFALPRVDLSGLPESRRGPQAFALAAGEAGRPFDLTGDPLLRGLLLRLTEDDHVVALTLHHIASDGWSMGLLVREVAVLYTAFAESRPSPLADLPVQYADFALWQRSWLHGEVLENEISFWRRQLADLPPHLALPADRPRPATQSFRGALIPVHLPAASTRQAEALARREGATLFMLLLAAFQALLARTSGQDDLAVGSPVAGRNRLETEGLIGFFVNTLVLRGDLGRRPSFRELLGRVRETTLAAWLHQDVPFERLVQELAPERSLGHAPLFQAMLALQNAPLGELGLPGLRLTPVPVEKSRTELDLDLAWSTGAEGLAGSLVYAADLFDRSTIERLAGHLVRLLVEGVKEPDRPLAELPLLAAEERHQLLVEWSGRAASVPSLVPELFAAQAERTPEAVAVSSPWGILTYGELARRAGSLAGDLRACGAGPEVVVALFVDRSPDLPAALLGVLAAGGVYVPLDPTTPRDRLAFLLEDCGAAVVLTQKHLEARLPPTPARVLLLEEVPVRAEPPEGRPIDLEQAAYVIYTSGSTGLPKGAVVSHCSLASFALAYVERLGLTAEDRVLQFAALGFDVVVEEIFPTLLAGGRVVLRDPQELVTPYGLMRAIAEEGVTTVELPTAFWHEWVFELERTGERVPACLRRVLTGTERLLPERLDAWRKHGVSLVHVFGLTEVTVTSLLHVLPPRDGASAAAPPPVGRPFGGTRAWLLDEALREVPVGVPGELSLGGPGVARGYLRRPDLTAERFVPDPFCGVPGARMYRTGDRLRWLPDGTLDFLGRLDRQVKLRGFRIEPGEIESALAALPGVGQAVVMVRSDRLVAWLVGDAPPDAELRRLLGERLPEHMVPSAFVRLAALPLTPNGKVDRKALPAPEPGPQDGWQAPRTPVEEVLAGIWAEVLGLDRVGAGGHFFDLGGHSLLATRVLSRLRSAFGIELPLRDLFEAPVLADLAARVEAAQRAGTAASAPPLVPVPREGPLPLSFAQQRLWFIDQLEPGSPLYNMPVALGIEGPLDPGVLARCLGEIERRHEALRTVFAAGDGTPVQVIRPPAPFVLPVVDLSGLPAGRRAPQALALAGEEAARPFDLGVSRRGPLLRAVLLRVGEGDHVVSLTLHHIVSDGWSMDVLVQEITALYAAFAEGRPSPLPELPVQYADFALWQRSWLRGEVLESEVDFWRRRLAGLPPLLELPTDRPRPVVQSYRGASRPVLLSAALTRQAEALGRREGATLFMVLLAAFQALLARYSGQDDLAVGSPVAGRNRLETEGLIGFFVNTLVLRGDLTGRPSFRELLGQAREMVLAAHLHQDVPFEKLVEELVSERSLAHSALFQVMFTLEKAPAGSLEIPGLRLRPAGGTGTTAKFDLALNLTEHGGAIDGEIEYSTDLFDAVTIDHLRAHFEILLDPATAASEQPVAGLPLLTRAERHQLHVEWNDTAAAVAPGVVERFEAQVRQTPEAVAVVLAEDPGSALTYGELDRRASLLARRLRALGVGPEMPVGLCVEQGPELAVGVLGIFKSGGALLALDPSHPPARLVFLLQDAAVPVLVTQAQLQDRLPLHGARTVLLEEPSPPASFPPTGEWSPAQASDLAYLIYTSGTTGQPKAVLVEHGMLAATLSATRELFGFAAGDRMPCLALPTFDISLFELLSPLLIGGTAVFFPRRPTLDVERLVDRLGELTLLHAVPALMRGILDSLRRRGGGDSNLRAVFVGGDTVPADLLEELRETFPSARVWVLYGPTEGTILCAAHPVPPAPTPARPLLGRPLAGAVLEVRDANGELLPLEVPGELWIGGAGVTRGYLRHDELTAEKYVVAGGERFYRSGDRARRLADGTLEFLGRLDHQVKIRGFRIEPGEIEAALCALPGVSQAVALVRDEGAGRDPGARRLVAYVAGDATPDELRRSLQARLPEYMIPAAFVVLEALPLTPNGKVDRKALPAPERQGTEESGSAPRTPTEEVLAGIWAELLELERVGVNDHFFDLGGHSLLATRVIARIRAAFGVDLPLRALFESPTVAGLAARIGEGGGEAPASPPLVPALREGDLPLSFAQQRLLFLHMLEPEDVSYNMPYGLRLRGPLEPARLRGALRLLIARHEVLRTTFAFAEGQPVQRIQPAGTEDLPLLDLAGLPDAVAEREASRIVGDETLRPFDLLRGPVLRAVLLRCQPEEHVLFANIHHIAMDGWSQAIFFREVVELYEKGEAAGLPGLPIQYADYALWQRRWLQGEVLDRQLGYWRERLAGLAPTELPGDRPRPAVRGGQGAIQPLAIPGELTNALRALGRQEDATLFMSLLAAFAVLVHRSTGGDRLVLGTDIANRRHAELDGLIGLFINQLALSVDLSGDPTFRDVLRQVRRDTLEAYMHQDAPFDRLVDLLSPERDLSRTPLFQLKLVLQNAPRAEQSLRDLTVTPLDLPRQTAKFDLLLNLIESGEGIAGQAEYSTDLFEAATIARFLDGFTKVLRTVAERPDTPLREIESELARLQARDEEKQDQERWSNALARKRRRVLVDQAAS